ncbi:hypothetical protein [Citrobacter freundii]|uniref:hypothetical protein n=1 Tax=Citrobacter freundii TaxID=546 RepID=UPI00190415E6|nr:hypothetical protein [Citrobacter freundii]EJM7592375.1 hypothetical protein [Citrobacter freundii]ELP5236379.1 hypothetical protein [Citrobacter freundii]MBJ9035016.1 hypothetical protein [Citrobacter freundii]MCH9318063.1 hypothetical protein [Citrobacter freundii]MDT7325901.1 hypothetical protein [Citrobacter freundii]
MPLSNNNGRSNQQTNSQQTVKGKIVYSNRLPHETNPEGWLKVKLEPSGFAFLHENTKLIVLSEKNDRVYYRVESDKVELMGKIVSIAKNNAIICTHKTGPTQKSVVLKVKYDGAPVNTYSKFKGWLVQQFANLNVNGTVIKVTLNSIWSGKYSPIVPGRHKIMAPDHSHNTNAATIGYRMAFPAGTIVCNDIWFPIELEGGSGNSSRYIHLGNLSEGCVTIYEVEKWNVVYNYLINHRTPGTKGLYIGDLIVEK